MIFEYVIFLAIHIRLMYEFKVISLSILRCVRKHINIKIYYADWTKFILKQFVK